MEGLEINIAALLQKLGGTGNPGSRALKLTFFASSTLRHGQISLYEAYLLYAEALSYDRQAYLAPGWPNKVQISSLAKLLNMKMLALVFGETEAAALWEKQALELYPLNQEKRPHYLLERYPAFLRAEQDPALLEELLRVRKSRKKPFDDGPYHDECFPDDRCVYEEMLLQGRVFSEEDKRISPQIEELLVELYLLQE